MRASATLLGPDGPFSQSLKAFRPRVQQQEMTEEIESLIEHRGGVLVAESPTGTGKTLAYLVPVVSAGARAIISTATRHLQDQIFYKDLPQVLKTLGIRRRICLLKGRSNYLCLHRLHTQGAVEAAKKRSLQRHYKVLVEWSQQTQTGDINDVESLEEKSALRPLVTSTTDNCLGGECTHFDDCFVRKARLKALDADIVVVNHHLYMANLALREDGLGQLLPEPDTLVFDEAHHLPDIASMQLSRSITSRQIVLLISDLQAVLHAKSDSVDEFYEAMQELEGCLMHVERVLGKPGKYEARAYFNTRPVYDGFIQMLVALETLAGLLNALTGEKEYELLYKRADALAGLLGECLYEEHEQEKYFCWIEITGSGFRLNLTPLALDSLGQKLSDPAGPATVLVSATLSSGGDFSYFCDQLGLFDISSFAWSSPFDFETNCRMYLPDAMPDPRSPQFGDCLLEQAVKLIELCQGRTFFLFTSHQAMETAWPKLKQWIDYPILKQGQFPKHELIDRFIRHGNAVLLGTSSFWEGVDVKGPELSCVIIDKLPFASPDEPVLKARLKRMEQNQRNPFMHYQLPQMIISLKQGIGRLIRDEQDRGIIMIGDSRLLNKPYGAKVLSALPPIPRTSDIQEINSFVHTSIT